MRVATIMCYPYGEIVKLNLYLTPYKNQLQMHQELKSERCNFKTSRNNTENIYFKQWYKARFVKQGRTGEKIKIILANFKMKILIR